MGVQSINKSRVSVIQIAQSRNTMTDGTFAEVSHCDLFYHKGIGSGSENNQADRGWEYSATISSGGTLVIDIYDVGSLDTGAGGGRDALGS